MRGGGRACWGGWRPPGRPHRGHPEDGPAWREGRAESGRGPGADGAVEEGTGRRPHGDGEPGLEDRGGRRTEMSHLAPTFNQIRAKVLAVRRKAPEARF